jgi:hypothetical protein
MKKIIVCLALAALVFVPALQAGENKAKTTSTKAEASCATATVAKAESCSAKTACCSSAKSIAKRGLKGGALLASR